MKDGRHMLSGEGGAAPSSRFKSKTTVGRARHFSEVLKKEEIGQVKILEVQNGSFYRQKFKCALNVLHTSIKSARDGISEIEEVSLEIEEAIRRSKRRQLSQKLGLLTNHQFQIPKSVNCLSLISTYHTQLSFAKITGSLSKHRFQPSVSLSLVSTCHMQSLPSTKLRTRSVNSGY
ncbi:hypothetical protein ACFX16_027899 [Malus domestica]